LEETPPSTQHSQNSASLSPQTYAQLVTPPPRTPLSQRYHDGNVTPPGSDSSDIIPESPRDDDMPHDDPNTSQGETLVLPKMAIRLGYEDKFEFQKFQVLSHS
jgi:hypothetical protein